MKIAFVSMHTSPAMQPGSGDAGGMNVVERAQAEALGRLGHQVELITRRSDPADPDAVDLAPAVVLRHLDAGPRAPLPKSEIDRHIDQFRDGLSRLAGYDLVHSHHWMSGVAALPLANQWGVPHVQSFHSVAAPVGSPLSEGERPESPARIDGEAMLARRSQAVVAISAAEAHTVIERCGATPERVHIVSPGVDLELFRPQGEGCWAKERGYANGYVLFAARLEPLKGPQLAIEAVAQLPADIRPHLVVAGDSPADYAGFPEKLRELAKSFGLEHDVTFVGPQSRAALAALMRCARVVLVPSYSETFGLVALEAAASGTPVIASASGGLREAVAHGETGQLMDSRHPDDWGKALKRLLTQPGLLETMGVVARVHARRFDWDCAALRLQTIYQQLLP
ncbi:MAG: glycosyltransferase [Propionibacteriaceae bacterium]|nr:glycosyltransferase [Propionibacteriaceae bacterium]